MRASPFVFLDLVGRFVTDGATVTLAIRIGDCPFAVDPQNKEMPKTLPFECLECEPTTATGLRAMSFERLSVYGTAIPTITLTVGMGVIVIAIGPEHNKRAKALTM